MWKYNETNNLPGNSLYHSADELYHYGVLGMRWGHRNRSQLSAELKELKGYDRYAKKHPNSLGSSKISTHIRNKQINKLKKEIHKIDTAPQRKVIKKELAKNKLSKAGLTTLQGVNALAGGYTGYTAAKAIKNKQYGKALVRTVLTALAISNIHDAQKIKNNYKPKIKKGKEALKKLKYMQ